MQRILVKPRDGLKVRDPVKPNLGHLPAEGRVVLDGQAWRRLEMAGDVTIEPEPAPAAAAAAPAPKSKKE